MTFFTNFTELQLCQLSLILSWCFVYFLRPSWQTNQNLMYLLISLHNINRLVPVHHLLFRVEFLILFAILNFNLLLVAFQYTIHISLEISDFNPKFFNLSRWVVPNERGLIYHIKQCSIQAWSIAAFHRRPRPPRCLVSVFNAVKLFQMSCETGTNSPPRDQNSCPSIASECQQKAERPLPSSPREDGNYSPYI